MFNVLSIDGSSCQMPREPFACFFKSYPFVTIRCNPPARNPREEVMGHPVKFGHAVKFGHDRLYPV